MNNAQRALNDELGLATHKETRKAIGQVIEHLLDRGQISREDDSLSLK